VVNFKIEMLASLDFRPAVSRFLPRVMFVALHVLLLAPFASGQSGVQLTGIIELNGEAMPAFTLNLFTADRVLTATTDKTGHFEFSNLPPGTYDIYGAFEGSEAAVYGLRIEDKNIGPITIPLKIVQTVYALSPDCGRTFWVTYHPDDASGGRLKGTLTLSPSVPAPNRLLANVKIDLTNAAIPHRRVSERVDNRGNFEFLNLRPGRYHLRAHASGYRKTEATIWIARRDSTTTKIILHKRGDDAICE
jgi:hypothetical protein